MEQWEKALKDMLNEELEHIVLSNSRNTKEITKVKIRPVVLKDQLLFQRTKFIGKQVFHNNLTAQEVYEEILYDIENTFKQLQAVAEKEELTLLISKNGKITAKQKRKNPVAWEEQRKPKNMAHNKQKQYILPQDKPVDFLVALGVQGETGKILQPKYDKFRQINRYLEYIADIYEVFPKEQTLRIIDFGCGKSYLTFAMYYFFHEIKGRQVDMIGLDLKEDVIAHCNELAKRLRYEGLHFENGDIHHFQNAEKQVDMVVTLHACDLATDYALEKAIRWNSKVIMAVPCCQHEINKQIQNDLLKPILKYGYLKERMSALITDGIRANIMEKWGYDTQILEFIDMEHTPKNILLRGVKKENMRPKRDAGSLTLLEEQLSLHPTLEALLREED